MQDYNPASNDRNEHCNTMYAGVSAAGVSAASVRLPKLIG